MNRTCTICGRSDVDFYKTSGNHCKTCCIQQTNEYRKAHPDVQRKTRQNARCKPGYREHHRDRMRKYREENPDYVRRSKATHYEYNQAHRKELLAKSVIRQAAGRQFINTFKGKPCIDCNGTFPFHVMDFDHVRGLKRFNVGEMGTHSLQAITDEIEKCDLICANCHRIRTYDRQHSI